MSDKAQEIDVEAECPSCKKHLIVSVPTPEKPAAAAAQPVADQSERFRAIEAKLANIPEDFCSRFPDLCNRVEALQTSVDERLSDMEHAEIVPNDVLINHFESCPNCKPIWDEQVAKIVAKAKASEPAPVKPEPQDKPTKEEAVEPPAEKEPKDDGRFHLDL